MGRFTKQNTEVQKVWRAANLVILSEEQIKRMDEGLERFNKIGTRKDLFKYLVHVGAAVWIAGAQIAIRPEQYEAAMHRIGQWKRWRERKFPFNMRVAYEKIAEQRGFVAEDHMVIA